VLPTSGRIAAATFVPERTGFMLVDTLLAGDLRAFGDALRHLVLPAVTLGVVFSAGRGATLGKLIRIGHMGPVAEPIYAVVAVAALAAALNKLGRKVDAGAAVNAALAVTANA
jgi:ABC-type Mn2+/Zn2+ transport system permease subunit